MKTNWLIWLSLCAGALLSSTLIASAVAVHSQRFDGRSVLVAIIFTLGGEVILTTVVMLIDALAGWLD